MKKILAVIFFFLFTIPLFSQLTQQQHAQPWWLTLEQGKLKFRNGDYGQALLLFEDARRSRKTMYEQMERDLILMLSESAVRRLGDSLERIDKYSRDMHYIKAASALNELYYRVPKESLNNSAKTALEAVGKLKDYPEAEYWIGEVYRVEGELPLALIQYRRALQMSDNLEDPNFVTVLQYKIASALFTRQDYSEMEKTYMFIIDNYDTLWANSKRAETTRAQIASTEASGAKAPPVPYAQSSASFAASAMTRTLENDGIGRFLELYRYNNTTVEGAHRQLGLFFAATGRPTAQNHLMFAFLIQNTVVLEEITRLQFDFSLSEGDYHRRNRTVRSTRELVKINEEINKNQALQKYVEEVEYYKTIYYLAASLYRNGKTDTARDFWEFLAAVPEAGEWHHRAVSQRQNNRTEPIVERP